MIPIMAVLCTFIFIDDADNDSCQYILCFIDDADNSRQLLEEPDSKQQHITREELRNRLP